MGNAFINYLKFLLRIIKPSTQTSIAERDTLKRYAKGKRNAIEIGVFQAVNSVLIVREMAEEGVLFGIDPFYKGRFGVCWNEEITKLHLKRSGVSKRVKLLKVHSYDAVPFIDQKPDFIFVDGDHSWDGIKKDWLVYSELIMTGGIIALHDTSVPEHETWKTNMDSVKFFQFHISNHPGFKLLETVDSLNILEKL